MLFNSWQFAIFLPVVVVLYFVLPHRFRNYWLLAASYYFYISWNPELIVLIAGTTLATYFCALRIARPAAKPAGRKAYLLLGVLLPLGVLFFFKYFNFFTSYATVFLRLLLPLGESRTLDIILPVGISFYTFQALSYVIDVYRGVLPPENRLANYALYISFFPQLVAGPIERSTNLLPQFDEVHRFDYDNAADGLKIMALGFFKKLVIADNVGAMVDWVYENLPRRTGFTLILATVLFAIQIYCDFSGYSDIATGTARILGFRLMRNFNSPYLSRSIQEFWKRWHISLSTWFQDYVYIPLGGSRVRIPRYYFNLMVTFLVSGLWHGAGLSFVAWGMLHGVYRIIGSATKKPRDRLLHRLGISRDAWWMRCLSTATTFLLVCVAWTFFRADRLLDAFYVFRHAFDGIERPLQYLRDGYVGVGLNIAVLAQLLLTVGMLFYIDLVQLREDPIERLNRRPAALRWSVYIFVFTLIVILTDKGIPSRFIYFQF